MIGARLLRVRRAPARSPGLLALELIGGVIAATGITVLSHSPVTLAEECRESRTAGAQPARPPATGTELDEFLLRDVYEFASATA